MNNTQSTQHSTLTTIIRFMVLLLLVSIFLSCSNKEQANIDELCKTALESSDGEQQKKAASEYLLALVIYQSAQLAISPKKLNKDALVTARMFARDMIEKYSDLEYNFEFRVNQATISNLLGSYNYNVVGDAVKAVQMTEDGIIIIDGLVDNFPHNPLSYAYRAINFSHFPEIFGKKKIILNDIAFLIDYVNSHDEYTEYERSMIPRVFNRAKEYSAENGGLSEIPSDEELDVLIIKIENAPKKSTDT